MKNDEEEFNLWTKEKTRTENTFYSEEVESSINGRYFLHRGSTVRAPGIRNSTAIQKKTHERNRKDVRVLLKSAEIVRVVCCGLCPVLFR
jgi:hypothetical protein